MALDAIAVRCLTEEIKANAIGCRIDKISQPERDEIVLTLRSRSGSEKLLLCANSAYPRVHFTNVQKSNPMTAPLFCMLLRKHLGSGKITDVRQAGFERIIEIDVESYDELGELSVKTLIAEIMGRHSNIILVQNGKIIDSIKHIDFTVSSVRQVLPGFMYEYPPSQDRVAFIDFDQNSQIDISQKGQSTDKAILSSVAGISPLTAREIVYRAYRTTDIRNEQIVDTEKILSSLLALKSEVETGEFSPCIITENGSGKYIDFSAFSISQYENMATVEEYSTMSEAADAFYSGKDALERMKRKSADLVKLLNTNIERASKKHSILLQTLKDAENKDKYKIYGELITANLYLLGESEKVARVINYFDEAMEEIEIPLDPSLSPSANAQKYFKKYQKAKTAEVEAAKQLKENRAVSEYLESTLVSVLNAETEADLNAVRTELAEQGYLKRLVLKKNKKLPSSSKPMHFVSSDGFDIYVGRNNTQNDYLTLKFANSGDIWFHTKNIHGSHTVIKLGLDKNVPDTTLMEAACLAAYYSKGRDSSQVPVDYTEIKNVKKPSGAKPGMVIYDKYNTVYVTPKLLEKQN